MKYVAAFVSLILSLVLLDWAVGAYYQVPSRYLTQIIRVEPTLNPPKRLKPNLNTPIIGAYREFQFRLRTDADGFRLTTTRRQATTPILFLGDSQTVGVGVEDNETYPAKTAQAVKKDAVNAACYGYNTYEELQLVRSLIQNQTPSLVVLGFFAGNDPYENATYSKSMKTSNGEPARAMTLLDHLKNHLARHSFLYQSLSQLRKWPLINKFLYKAGMVKIEPPGELAVFRGELSAEGMHYWSLTKQAIGEIKSALVEKNIPLLVLFIPDRYQVDDRYWKAWVEKYRLGPEYDRMAPNRFMSDWCAKEGIRFLDATPALLLSEHQGVSPYWAIDNHLNKKGNLVIADQLAAYIKKEFSE